MNRSGLGGNIASFVIVFVMFVCILPFSIGNFGEIFDANVNLKFAVGAAVFGAVAMLLFNSILSKATPQNIGLLFVLMIITQIIVPAIYHVIMTGEVTITKIAGFMLAIIAAILLIL